MTIQGFRTTANFVVDGRPKHWRAGILLNYPNGDAPLFALTSAMKSEVVTDPEFNWWEKPMQTRRISLGANLDANTGTQTITVASGARGFKEGDLLLVEHTDEILMVASEPTSDTALSVTRAYGDVAATAVTYNGATVNPNLLGIGSAYEEGSDAPIGRAYDPTKKFNYTQIFRNTFEHTRTAIKTKLRTEDDVKEAKRETLELHSRDIEFAFLFGNRTEKTKNGKPIRTTGGILSFIQASNKKTVSNGQLDMQTLEGYMEEIFAFGSSEKIAFVGNRAMTAINQAVRRNSAYQIGAGEKLFGMTVTRIVSPHGELILKRHPLFNQVSGATGAQTYTALNSSMLVVDQAKLKYKHLKGDDTRYEPVLQANGVDGVKSGFITECGLELHNPECFYFVEGMNQGIADA